MRSLRRFVISIQKKSRKSTIFLVYLSLLLDNVVLTMVVPILPDFLVTSEKYGDPSKEVFNQGYQSSYRGIVFQAQFEKNASLTENFKSSLEEAFDLNSENGRVGLLLSSKALVQLFLNPVIGVATAKLGYQLPLFAGTCVLFVSVIIFAFGEKYVTLFLARSLQGIASSCIGIAGMCLVAETYPNEPDRSKIMGFVLGSVAVGVLVGYPFGGFAYESLGKSTPFLIIAVFVCLNGALQLCSSVTKPAEEKLFQNVSWFRLLADRKILLIGGAIGISTSTIAMLEPCLPIWLLNEMKPKKWQLGTAFIPDSVGYMIGTNSGGVFAYRVGRSKVALPAMILVGLSAAVIPSARSMLQLVTPHFFLGLGIGAVDAALVPLLAAVVDQKYLTYYGTVYAMQQMAVSLAYSLGPVLGSEIAGTIGFPWMMRLFGLVNILYSPFLIKLERLLDESSSEKLQIINYNQGESVRYQQFSDSEESE